MERAAAPSRLDAICQAIVNEKDAPVCTDISEEACRVLFAGAACRMARHSQKGLCQVVVP